MVLLDIELARWESWRDSRRRGAARRSTGDYGLALDEDEGPSFDFRATTPSEVVNADD